MAKRSKLVPVIPLPQYWKLLAVSLSQGKKFLNDPEFPRDGLVKIGANRLGIREDSAADFQLVLQRRAHEPRSVSVNLSNPKAAAAKSVEVRRAKAKARRVARLAEAGATP
jgi:hypothetical protein